jgi:hypothetical protein
MRTFALVIANDPGTGFEGSKYVSADREPSMIERVVAKAALWPVDEVVVVLGRRHRQGHTCSTISALPRPRIHHPMTASHDMMTATKTRCAKPVASSGRKKNSKNLTSNPSANSDLA